MKRGSGFTLQCIDGLMLAVYHYIPLGGSSYISLSQFISNKRTVINPQNMDQQCFKWSILVRYVIRDNKERVGINYSVHEEKFKFSGLIFLTPISEFRIFEKNNLNVSSIFIINQYLWTEENLPSHRGSILRTLI